MAQAVRHDEDDLESLLSQAKEMEKVGLGKKKPGAFVPAEKLNYVPPQAWEISKGGAELVGSIVLHVDGKYPTKELEKLTYKVSFVVSLLDNFNIETPVVLTLTLPDGSTQTNAYLLKDYPRNKPIGLKAGEFYNLFQGGDIKFALDGSECETWKKGLVIHGVMIWPIIIKPDPK